MGGPHRQEMEEKRYSITQNHFTMNWYFLRAEWRKYSSSAGCRLNHDRTYHIRADDQAQAEAWIRSQLGDPEGLEIGQIVPDGGERSVFVVDPAEASRHYRALAEHEKNLRQRLARVHATMQDLEAGMSWHFEYDKPYRIFSGVLWNNDGEGRARPLEMNIEPDFSAERILESMPLDSQE